VANVLDTQPALHGGVVGANVGRNKDSTDADRDYAAAAGRLAPLVEYLVINVSSPNTPGLRALQDRTALESLIRRVRAAMRDSVVKPPALLVKIAPDLADEDLDAVADLALELGLAGIIATNTTLAREGLRSMYREETGGLSGSPLRVQGEALLGKIVRLVDGKIPIVSVGGIMNPADAKRRLDMGATLIQIYTGLIYHGPGLVKKILRTLASAS